MTLFRVHMHLARSPEYPDGSKVHGYEIVLPLNISMQLDPKAWREHARECVVRRFWQGEPTRRGVLRHAGHSWFVDYDLKSEGDEEPLFKLEDHKVQQGEYLSITEQDGETRTFLITSVSPVSAMS